MVGLDFTPTMEVEVELDVDAKAVVFRSTRSTLYGNVGTPGEEGESEYFSDAGIHVIGRSVLLWGMILNVME